MKLNLAKELAALEQMTVGQLQQRYADVFGEAVRSRHKQYLIRRIAWRLQANAEGGLSERALRRAEELADVADVRVTPPRGGISAGTAAQTTRAAALSRPVDPRLPPAGAAITRKYKGQTLTVTVLADGFEYAGERYASLTAVAKAITGSHMNGFRFFKIEGQVVSRRETNAKKPAGVPTTRCAVYTRKSSDEGLQQEFNSLDAQREAAEAYVASQKAEGWVCLPDRYDDGGFTGGNMERPGLQRLIRDIDAGKVDCVVVYKVDRLSRSLMDFAKIVEVFERQNVSFVSVTQHFNTTNSMGRLTLNILLSFAQFEREIIGERIRDKIAASRQRGKWTGGTPVLGYDVDRTNGGPRLVINPEEASRVCQIFELYLELGSLLPVVTELERRDWRNKVWTTRDGRTRGGLPFDKCRLYNLLTNVLYVGKVRHKGEVYAGEHESIVSEAVFSRAQQQLQRNGRNGTVEHRNRHGALLRGLLYCKACDRVMSHTFTTRGNRRYRYYTCTNATKRGRRACPTASLSAIEIENAVIDQVRCIGHDPALVADTLGETRTSVDGASERLTGERRAVERGLARLHAELKRTAADDAAMSGTAAHLADLNDQVGAAERRLSEIDNRLAELRAERIDEADVAAALADFDKVWGVLCPREQARVIKLLVERVEFDAAVGAIEVSFHAAGIKALANGDQQAAENVEDAA